MNDFKSIKVEKDTYTWVVRLKGTLQRSSGKHYSLDNAILYGVMFSEWNLSKDKGLTTKSFDDYVEATHKELGIEQK